VLSKESFRRLGLALSQNLTNCPLGPYEDTEVHACLRKLGAYINKSIDHLGRERFHVNSLQNHFNYNGSADDGWTANPIRGVSYANIYDCLVKNLIILIEVILKGLECCSDSWISFHRVSKDEMIRLASILSRHEQQDSTNQENKVINKPTFKQIYEEFIRIEHVQKEMNNFAENGND
jgi:hypothetical protein